MPSKGEVGFNRTLNLMMNVFVGIALGVTFLFLTNDVLSTPVSSLVTSFFQSFALSVCAGYTLGDLLPAMQIAQRLCAKRGLKGGVARRLLTSLVLAFVNVTCILFVCMFVNLIQVGGVELVASVVVGLWPAAVAVGFATIAATLGLATKIASAVSGFEPTTVLG